MANCFQIVCVLCGVFQTMTVASGLQFVLDVLSDQETDMWSVKGDTIYMESGKNLHRGTMKKYLPENFKYARFEMTKGIWAVVPNVNKECAKNFDESDSLEWPSLDLDSFEDSPGSAHAKDSHSHDDHFNKTSTTTESSSTSTTKRPTTTEAPCDISSVGSFKFTLRAQLMESVAVVYNFGGNATIRITGGRMRQPFEIYANNLVSDHWEHFQVDVDGSTMRLEAIVNGTGDYILIDRITVKSLEPATTEPTTRHTTTRRSTTTTSPNTPTSSPSTNATTSPSTPTEAPASGQNGMLAILSMDLIIASNLLTILVIKSFFL